MTDTPISVTKVAKLQMITYQESSGTFGTIKSLDGTKTWYTAERSWFNNMPNVSCIPAGRYQLVFRESPSKGLRAHLHAPSLGVLKEPDGENPALRTYCMVHPANLPEEVHGCVGLGTSYFKNIHGVPYGVQNSRYAVTEFEDYLRRFYRKGYEVELEIIRLGFDKATVWSNPHA